MSKTCRLTAQFVSFKSEILGELSCFGASLAMLLTCLLICGIGLVAGQDYVDLSHPAGNGITYSWPWFDPLKLIIK